jgi:hypothetical protein
MILPRDSSDLMIATACPSCSGNGGIGNRRPDAGSGGQRPTGSKFLDCHTCEGTGWQLIHPKDLTPPLLTRLQAKLPSPTSTSPPA